MNAVLEILGEAYFSSTCKSNHQEMFHQGVTRDWKGNTERKSSYSSRLREIHSACPINVTNSIFSPVERQLVLSFNILLFSRGRKSNFAHDTVGCHLRFGLRSAYPSTDLHCILSGRHDMEDTWMMNTSCSPISSVNTSPH